MKKIFSTMIISLLILAAFGLNAEEVKSPVKLGLEAKTQLDSDTIDAKPSDTEFGDIGDIYLRNEIKGKAKFKVSDIYAITPWLKDRIDLKWYSNPASKKEPELGCTSSKRSRSSYLCLDRCATELSECYWLS